MRWRMGDGKINTESTEPMHQNSEQGERTVMGSPQVRHTWKQHLSAHSMLLATKSGLFGRTEDWIVQESWVQCPKSAVRLQAQHSVWVVWTIWEQRRQSI